MAYQDDGTHVRAPTLEDLRRICRSLNEAGARYVLIGGFAVIAHGGGRTTRDIDFLIDASPPNVSLMKRGLAVLEDNAAADLRDTDIEDYTVVRVADEVMVDLLAHACGVSYEAAMTDSEVVDLDGIPVPVASKQTLIRTKQTIRPTDQLDREFLKALIEEEGRGE